MNECQPEKEESSSTKLLGAESDTTQKAGALSVLSVAYSTTLCSGTCRPSAVAISSNRTDEDETVFGNNLT